MPPKTPPTNKVMSLLQGIRKFPAPAHFRVLFRQAGQRLRSPASPRVHQAVIRSRQERLVREDFANASRLASIQVLRGRGPAPTIVIGGFVPDATESVYLMRELLAKHGDVYCLNYSLGGFSLDLFLAQLDDLVEELSVLHGTDPVVFCVSFGCGLVLEWLRRRREMGGHPAIRAVLLVSPVACSGDLLPAAAGEKPRTLLGRAIRPYLQGGAVAEATVEKSRQIFGKMFEAGAQNREALATLMSRAELEQLRERVLGTIRRIEHAGACERVGALCSLRSPLSYFEPATLPLAEVPVMVLFAEKEDSVLDPDSPTRTALTGLLPAYFPKGLCRLVRNTGGSPVQHASLIFHVANFRKPIAAFYRGLRGGLFRRKAA